MTSTDVSRAATELDAQLTTWRERPLGRCAYLVLDARYEKVRHGGSVIDCAVLVAMGVREEDGKRTLLGVSVSLSEAEVHWRAFLEGLRQRGLRVTKLITSDDHAGLRAARRAEPAVGSDASFTCSRTPRPTCPTSPCGRKWLGICAPCSTPPSAAEADERVREPFDKYRRPAPKLAEWMEANVPEGLAVFALPEPHRRRLRTTIERLNRELHRRTRVATLFPTRGLLPSLGRDVDGTVLIGPRAGNTAVE